MRIGFTVIGEDGLRGEDWVSFIPVNYKNTMRKRMVHYDGPDVNASSGKKIVLSLDTRIAELAAWTTTEEINQEIYVLWSAHFGPLKMDPLKEATNRKRRNREASRCDGNKRAKTESDTPIPTVELGDETAQLTAAELSERFHTLDEPIDDNGYTRMAQEVQATTKTVNPPPIQLLKRIRHRASKYAKEYPQAVWADSEYCDWMESAPKATDTFEEPRAESPPLGVEWARYKAELEADCKEARELLATYFPKKGKDHE
jgi:hypothetical protein